MALDWEATLAYRRYLWSLGLAVAEAMDTAQRGHGAWIGIQRRNSSAGPVAEAQADGGNIACGAGTDHLIPHPDLNPSSRLKQPMKSRCGYVESEGGRVILMASRALAACATGLDDYVQVYGRILSQVSQPVIIHWLGECL